MPDHYWEGSLGEQVSCHFDDEVDDECELWGFSLLERYAAILCFLSALAGWQVVSGAAIGASAFVWNCLKGSIMWFIT